MLRKKLKIKLTGYRPSICTLEAHPVLPGSLPLVTVLIHQAPWLHLCEMQPNGEVPRVTSRWRICQDKMLEFQGGTIWIKSEEPRSKASLILLNPSFYQIIFFVFHSKLNSETGGKRKEEKITSCCHQLCQISQGPRGIPGPKLCWGLGRWSYGERLFVNLKAAVMFPCQAFLKAYFKKKKD